MIIWPLIYGEEDDPRIGRALTGYWPKDQMLSGVTVADGIDLGQYSEREMAALPPDLQEKIKPYLGVKGPRAQFLLNASPLALTNAECELIEAPKRQEMTAQLSRQYLKAAAEPFESLDDIPQTVLMDVTWQYGTPWVRCPRFWRLACARDWTGLIAELRNFGDSYTKRRNDEADWLSKWLAEAA